MTINFYLDNSKTLKGDPSIYCYLRESSMTYKFNIRHRISKQFWDVKKQRAKTKYPNHEELNEYINSLTKNLNRIILKAKIKDQTATFAEVIHSVKEFYSRKQKSFFDVYSEYIAILNYANSQKHSALKKHLLNFQTKKKYQVDFFSINKKFYTKFKTYLFEDAKMLNSSFNNTIRFLKVFLTWAADNGYNKYSIFKEFKSVREDEKDIIFLSSDELEFLYKYDFKSERLSKVRDVFCFGCYTGQRFSDITKIVRTEIIGSQWFVKTKKVGKNLIVDLLPQAQSILDKYKDAAKPLPVISNQKLNIYIKECCKIIAEDPTNTQGFFSREFKISRKSGDNLVDKFTKNENVDSIKKYDLIASHTARRTFVSLSLMKGMSPQSIMKYTGHTDYKTFKKYLDITEDYQKQQLNDAWITE